MSHRILVVEDDRTIARAIADRLVSEGFDCDVSSDGLDAVDVASARRPDLVVLDLMLPGLDGIEVCRRIQADRSTPVLMLTARSEEPDLLVGLGVGADDYMTKPFSQKELVARIRAILRRIERERAGSAESATSTTLSVGEVSIDLAKRTVLLGSSTVELTATEFDLLSNLAAHAGAVRSRSQLLFEVWGHRDTSGDRTVDSHVRSIRRKLGDDVIRTVHGVGYASQIGESPNGASVKPLERVGSVKLKLGLLIVAAVGISAAMSQIGFRLGWPIWSRPIVAFFVSLVFVWLLSRGMTSPLRQMAAATRVMARGDKVDPIETRSRDEIGELARAFNSMTGELEALETERRALVANAAHELRTPIAGLQATLENIRDGVTSPTPVVIDRLSGQADRLGHIVNELLDLSRLEAIDHPLRREQLAVADVIGPAVSTATGDRADISPTIRVDGELAVAGDPSLLGRLITNLVRNAVLHGDAETIAVHATSDGTHVAIAVSDDGPGLSFADPSRVFDRFVRGDRSRSEDRPGTGLGLAISQAIAQRHGGRIEVENLEPSGCRFTVTLPAA